MESNRAESGQTRQGEHCPFLAFAVFVRFLGFMQRSSGCLFLFYGPELGGLQPKTFGTPTSADFHPTCLHALESSPTAIANLRNPLPRHVKPGGPPPYPAQTLAVNMLFFPPKLRIRPVLNIKRNETVELTQLFCDVIGLRTVRQRARLEGLEPAKQSEASKSLQPTIENSDYDRGRTHETRGFLALLLSFFVCTFLPRTTCAE
jgi:hypothetical protein